MFHLPFQPNRVANHIFSPLMMACCGEALNCMKLLIEVGQVADLMYFIMFFFIFSAPYFFRVTCWVQNPG